MSVRVFTFYKLRPNVDIEEFKEWSRTVDQPTCHRMTACHRFEVFIVKGEASGKDAYDVIEDIEVESWEDWQATLVSKEFAQVAEEWPRFGDESSLYSVHCERI